MKRLVMIGAVAGLAIFPALLTAQTAPAGRGNAATTRGSFEKFTVDGQPIDRRPPELDTDHPVFPGQTHEHVPSAFIERYACGKERSAKEPFICGSSRWL